MKPGILLIALSLFSMSLHAGVFCWTNKGGAFECGENVPSDVETARIVHNLAGKDQAAAPATFSNKSVAEREAELRKTKKEKEETASKKAQEKAQADLKKENCAASRENLRVLEENTRISTHDANGERTFLDDAAREQRLNDTRKAISSNCN